MDAVEVPYETVWWILYYFNHLWDIMTLISIAKSDLHLY